MRIRLNHKTERAIVWNLLLILCFLAWLVIGFYVAGAVQ